MNRREGRSYEKSLADASSTIFWIPGWQATRATLQKRPLANRHNLTASTIAIRTVKPFETALEALTEASHLDECNCRVFAKLFS